MVKRKDKISIIGYYDSNFGDLFMLEKILNNIPKSIRIVKIFTFGNLDLSQIKLNHEIIEYRVFSMTSLSIFLRFLKFLSLSDLGLYSRGTMAFQVLRLLSISIYGAYYPKFMTMEGEQSLNILIITKIVKAMLPVIAVSWISTQFGGKIEWMALTTTFTFLMLGNVNIILSLREMKYNPGNILKKLFSNFSYLVPLLPFIVFDFVIISEYSITLELIKFGVFIILFLPFLISFLKDTDIRNVVYSKS